jgi:tetratricopeptide (TPR) repeat protein
MMLSSFKCCFKEKKRRAVHVNAKNVNDVKNVNVDHVTTAQQIELQIVVTKEEEETQTQTQTQTQNDYYDFLAPSVYHLQTSFLHQIKESGLDETATLYDIENLQADEPGLIRQKGVTVNCPIDGKPGAAYVHCLELEESLAGGDGDGNEGPDRDHVGTSTHMLSYAWGYTYGDIVDTLVEFCNANNLSPKRTYVWICAFCNNQHRVVDGTVPFEDFKYVFKKRVQGIGNILAMMTPWYDPGYLKRVWCIFEMYSANADQGTSIQIIMPPRQKRSLMAAVLKPTDERGKNGLDELFATLASTKVEHASASRTQDKDNILRLVEDGPGCTKFNADINHLLRAWIRDTVFEAAANAEASLDVDTDAVRSRQETATFLTFCASFFSRSGAHQEASELHQKGLDIYRTLGTEDANELMARCYNNLGTEYESLGQYEEALAMHHKCREAFEEIYGTDHENTSVSYFNIGAVLRKMDKMDEALEMYEKSMNIDKRVKGENHIDVALSYSYIGRVKQNKQDYDGALEMFEKSLQIREDTYGQNHPDAAIGYGDMGLLYHMRGEYDEAIKMHLKAMAIQEQILGSAHPDTASVYQNIGGAYYEQGLYEKALEFHTKAKAAYASSFGKDHPKNTTSDQWIQIVEDAIAGK